MPRIPLPHAYTVAELQAQERMENRLCQIMSPAYDNLSHATSGGRFWQNDTGVAGQQFGYASDDLGKRKTTDKNRAQEGNGASMTAKEEDVQLCNQAATEAAMMFDRIEEEDVLHHQG